MTRTSAGRDTDDIRKTVLVTGASTGIGRKIAEWLAAEDHVVYACARNRSDLQALANIENVTALRLDVTSSHDIAAAVEKVARDGRGLDGLVNNAGVATCGSVVDGNEKEFDLVMAVNVYGPYRMTKAFAPLIVATRGRIVMMGSISGILADRNLSGYSMSKHAIEALTDSLALEMEPLGVQVSVIEPGGFNTELINKAMERIGVDANLPSLSECKEPDDVAAAVALALFEPKPKRRYLVVSNEDEAQRTIKKQMAQLAELNEGHTYTYNRNALIKMLDEALAQSRRRTASIEASRGFRAGICGPHGID